jgi:hypothetical protein
VFQTYSSLHQAFSNKGEAKGEAKGRAKGAAKKMSVMLFMPDSVLFCKKKHES